VHEDPKLVSNSSLRVFTFEPSGSYGIIRCHDDERLIAALKSVPEPLKDTFLS
jgi:RNase P/RNase MRP subunit POP5